MGSVDGTSIHTNRLAYTWKVEMKRKDSVKEEGGSETWKSEKERENYYSI